MYSAIMLFIWGIRANLHIVKFYETCNRLYVVVNYIQSNIQSVKDKHKLQDKAEWITELKT